VWSSKPCIKWGPSDPPWEGKDIRRPILSYLRMAYMCVPDQRTRRTNAFVASRVTKQRCGLLPNYFGLSTHTDRQGVDISVTVCLCVCVCLFVRLRISPPRTKLAASYFARRFIGVQGRESSIFVNFAFEAQFRSPKSDETASERATPSRM